MAVVVRELVLFSSLALLLCSARGAKDQERDLMVGQLKNVFKLTGGERQVDYYDYDFGSCTEDQLNDFLINYPSSCLDVLSDLYDYTSDPNYEGLCTPKCVDPLIEFFLQCNFTVEGEGLKAVCGRNEYGILCFQEIDDHQDEIETAQQLCYDERDNVNQTCSGECSSALRTMMNDFGCCVENIFNTTNALGQEAGFQDLSAYALWNNCGLDTESLTFCLYETVTVGLSPAAIFGEGTFSEAEFETISNYPHKCLDVLDEVIEADYDKPRLSIDYETLCSSACIDPLLQFYTDECATCSSHIVGVMAMCGKNGNEEFCIETLHDHYNEIDAAETYCHDRATSGQCSSDCRQALQSLKLDFDCCLTNFFSDLSLAEAEGYTNLSDSYLWAQCSLKSPGDCLYRSPTSGLSSGAIAGIVVGALMLIILLVMLIVLVAVFGLKRSSPRPVRYSVQADKDYEDEEPLT